MGRYLREYSAWIWLVAALAFVAALKIVTAQPSTAPPPLSAASDQPNGALAAYLWLGTLGYQVERASDSAPAVAALQPGRDTVMVISPQATFSDKLASSLLGWVRAGGRLVLATDGNSAGRLVSALGVQISTTTFPEPITVRQPLLLAPAVTALSGPAPAVAQVPPRAVAVAAANDGAVLLRLPYGRGVVWLLTAPTLLDNASVQRADNRALLLNLAGRPPARVAFDDYEVPAAGPALPSDWLTQTVWGVAILFGLLLLALYRWLAGWRLGPPVVPLTDRHRPLTEYVVSVAGLLRRGQERSGVLRMYQERLVRELRERFGPEYDAALAGDVHVPADAPMMSQVERLLAPPGQLSEEDLLRRAEQIVQCEDQLRRVRV